ncbi:START domain-containing protein [Ferruginibacter paludis]|uniref:START domain-containing protein n=1 Tax=Ferruginibacter paludis TaxID=1310417 RepID=UPI0025B2BE80|nr:START domain-containing protein [Ferruginibacter paludis]MDN3655237.1 START domain-containing protein [Ferruginibacter paludis]
MKFTSIFLVLSLVLLATAKSQDGWNLKKDKNGIKVFSKKSDKFKFDQLKVECVLDGKVSQLAAVLLDVDNQYQWVYKTNKSQLLKEMGEGDVLYYSEIACPWPFENRDLVVRMNIAQNAFNKVVTIEAKNVNDYLPAKDKLVRINYSNAQWTVTPISSGQLKVEYTIEVDPGNNVPAWLLNMFASNGPYESFVNLREKMKLAPYAEAKFSFLSDN